MKTVINEKTNEYTISFDTRRELEQYAWTSRFMVEYDRHIADHGSSQVIKTLEITDMRNKCLILRFEENGTKVAEVVVPIDFLRQYDEVVHRAFVHLSNVMASE